MTNKKIKALPAVIKYVAPLPFDEVLTKEDWDTFCNPIEGILRQEAIFLLGLWTQLHLLAEKHTEGYTEKQLIDDFQKNFKKRRDNEECMEVVMNAIASNFYLAAEYIDVHYTTPFEKWVTEEWWRSKKHGWNDNQILYGRKMIVARIWEYMLEYLNLNGTFTLFPETKYSPDSDCNLDLTKAGKWSTFYSYSKHNAAQVKYYDLDIPLANIKSLLPLDEYKNVWCKTHKKLENKTYYNETFETKSECGATIVCSVCENYLALYLINDKRLVCDCCLVYNGVLDDEQFSTEIEELNDKINDALDDNITFSE